MYRKLIFRLTVEMKNTKNHAITEEYMNLFRKRVFFFCLCIHASVPEHVFVFLLLQNFRICTPRIHAFLKISIEFYTYRVNKY